MKAPEARARKSWWITKVSNSSVLHFCENNFDKDKFGKDNFGKNNFGKNK